MFIVAMLTRLKFEVFLQGEYIIRSGTKGDRMYFIQKGIVEVITEDGTTVTCLSEGAHFGEIGLLTDDRRVASIRATTICDVFSLSKQNFQEVLEEYPEMRPILEIIAEKRLSKIGRVPEDETETTNHYLAGSPCRSRHCHREGAEPLPARSLMNELEAASFGRQRKVHVAAQSSTSYTTLPSKRSSQASVMKKLDPLGDEEYAEKNPHFVSHGEKSTSL